MADNEVKYKITGDSSSLVGATKQAGQSMTEMGGKASEAHAKGGKASEEHGKKVEGIRKLYRALDDVLPGLGAALEACFTPIGAVMAALAITIKLVTDRLKEQSEAAKKMADEAVAPLTANLKDQNTVTLEVTESQDRLSERLADASRAQNQMREQTEDTTRAMRALKEASDSVEDTNKEAELADLQRLHEQKLISEEDYQQKRLALEMKYRKLRRDQELAELQEEIAVRAAAVQNATQNQPGLDAAAKAADKKRAQDKRTADNKEAEIEQSKKRADDADKALRDWEHGHFDPADSVLGDVYGQLTGDSAEERRRKQILFETAGPNGTLQPGIGTKPSDFPEYEEWKRLKQTAEKERGYAQAAPKGAATARVQADQAEDEAKRAADQAEENRRFQRETQRKIDEDSVDATIKAERNRRIDEIEKGELRGAGVGAIDDALKQKFPSAPPGTPDLTDRFPRIGVPSVTPDQGIILSGHADATAKRDQAILDALHGVTQFANSTTAQVQDIRHEIDRLRRQIENQGSL